METSETCCDGSQVSVTRVILANVVEKANVDYIRGLTASNQNLVEYKTLSRRFGVTRKRLPISSEHGIQYKANTGRQILSSVASYVTPGDISPLRSPVRSAFYRTVTPGFGGGRRGGSLPGQNRARRCPEGYQYGGRFTDNRLSTCGQKLFDIPSLLGAAISAGRRALTSGIPTLTTGRPTTPGEYPSDIISSRAPQIPRVGNENKKISTNRLKEAIKAIGTFNNTNSTRVRRMVRRDGFVLEPIVPNKVLRAIPDNRDMEGASFVMSALSPKDIGGEELGLLSNTGIRSLVYVLPGGSSITLEKARTLEIGERRKLGRLVNTAQQINNAKDPSARLRNVVSEIGSGLRFYENFVGISNPNEIIDGRPRWTKQVWGKTTEAAKQSGTARETASFGGRKKLISNLNAAIDHVATGGLLSDIDPKTLAKVLAKSQSIQKTRMANNISAIATPTEKMFLYERPAKLQHLVERFASDVQQHLGLESPDILFVGEPGERRRFLRQDASMAIPGGNFNPNAKFAELEMRDVAALMISDFLTDQRTRPATSIYPIDTPDARRLVAGQNSTSGLIDLSKIEITKRMKMRIDDFYQSQLTPSYSDYYQALKIEQRVIFMKYLSELINRARSFNPSKFKSMMDGYGMSAGEKIHLNILEKLFESRLEVLRTQKNVLRGIVRGES